jgi:signal transduction histidine kinase
MTVFLRRLWASLGFRMASYYGLLVGITLLASLGIVYMQTVGVMYQRMTRQVSAAGQQLVAHYGSGGIDAVIAGIERAVDDDVNSESEIYLLTDRLGRKLAGNIDAIAEPAGVPRGDTMRGVVRAGQVLNAYVVSWPLPDGSLLVVGQDLREQENVESLVRSASTAAGIVALVLLVGGTFIFRQELDRSIAALRRTAARVGAGELQHRVEVSGGSQDEFALLHRDVNEMLDRIELLMSGVRHVSDTIAHNLRTPLTRIMLRLRSAESEAMPTGERQAAIAGALRDIEDLTATFEKLLQIAEVEAGAYRRKFAPVALATIADDVLEMYDAVAEAQQARLLRDPAEPATVNGDSDLLAGVVANLVDNALKYAGRGAVVRVGTAVAGGHVVLTVQDDGPGVPASEYPRMGTRFHRLDRATPGHGLGLASVQAVVALHGGQLRYGDAHPGLRVEIDLPVA